MDGRWGLGGCRVDGKSLGSTRKRNAPNRRGPPILFLFYFTCNFPKSYVDYGEYVCDGNSGCISMSFLGVGSARSHRRRRVHISSDRDNNMLSMVLKILGYAM